MSQSITEMLDQVRPDRPMTESELREAVQKMNRYEWYRMDHEARARYMMRQTRTLANAACVLAGGLVLTLTVTGVLALVALVW